MTLRAMAGFTGDLLVRWPTVYIGGTIGYIIAKAPCAPFSLSMTTGTTLGTIAIVSVLPSSLLGISIPHALLTIPYAVFNAMIAGNWAVYRPDDAPPDAERTAVLRTEALSIGFKAGLVAGGLTLATFGPISSVWIAALFSYGVGARVFSESMRQQVPERVGHVPGGPDI